MVSNLTTGLPQGAHYESTYNVNVNIVNNSIDVGVGSDYLREVVLTPCPPPNLYPSWTPYPPPVQ